MALLKCAKCGGKVSELAKRCPHCNCTIEEAIEGFSPIKVQNKPVMNVQAQKVNCPYEIRQGHLIRSIGVEGVAVIPDSVRVIDERAFENSLVAKVRFPLLGEVASIGKYAFRRCRNLQVMILPNGVNEIGEGCFEGCQNLERIIFSKSIHTIPSNAFSFCSKLKKITIPLSVEMIKEDAFIGTFIKEVTLPIKFKNQVSKLFPKATIVSFIEAESQDESNEHSKADCSQSVAIPLIKNSCDECVHNAQEPNHLGYDQDGHNQNGFDQQSYNQDGYNLDGYDKSGYDRNGYDSEGYNRQGFGEDGYDRSGFNRYGYNREGYDYRGFGRDGYNCAGFDEDGFDRDGYNKYGFDHDGFNRNGYNNKGFDKNGYDKEGYDIKGFDWYGFDREGYGKDGFHRETKLNREGETRAEALKAHKTLAVTWVKRR